MYSKDDLHIHGVGKAKLGSVLDECVRKELQRSRAQVQDRVFPLGRAGRDQSPEAAIGKSGEAEGKSCQVRSGDVFR